MAKLPVLRSCLFWMVVLQTSTVFGQLTTDSVQRYLIGEWYICGVNQSVFYFDSDAGTSSYISEHDEVSFKDSSLVFFEHGIFSKNGTLPKKQFTVSPLLISFGSPFKIALDKTEYIFEIRDPGFFLHRPILGTFDENEVYSYFFTRIGQCK